MSAIERFREEKSGRERCSSRLTNSSWIILLEKFDASTLAARCPLALDDRISTRYSTDVFSRCCALRYERKQTRERKQITESAEATMKFIRASRRKREKWEEALGRLASLCTSTFDWQRQSRFNCCTFCERNGERIGVARNLLFAIARASVDSALIRPIVHSIRALIWSRVREIKDDQTIYWNNCRVTHHASLH